MIGNHTWSIKICYRPT